MENGYAIEFGGFVTDRKTGKKELVFVTQFSELLCRERTKETAMKSNQYANTDYDLATLQVRYRKVEEYVGSWKDNEATAFNSSATKDKPEYWYSENWTEDDIKSALTDLNIKSTEENLKVATEYVKSEDFQGQFGMLPERKKLLQENLSRYFKRKKRNDFYRLVEAEYRKRGNGLGPIQLEMIRKRADKWIKWFGLSDAESLLINNFKEFHSGYYPVPVTLVGNKEEVFINPINCNATIDYSKAVNFASVDFEGVNHLVVKRLDDGQLWIIQAGGWTYDRGLFIDMYHINKKEDPEKVAKKIGLTATEEELITKLISKEKLTESARVTCQWNCLGQFVDLDYEYDYDNETALSSSCIFAEWYEDGTPTKQSWHDALCIGQYVAELMGIPLSIDSVNND
ncbi:hypothetical protein LKD70_03865 [Ruminococcus sp. CLA-AA-H200]|uniref:Uncharacterized protein n=1 Tax=Ruminococcus turbiniformis TaxID=2881258 RepID=A0ABS8FU42_9FIRM|nr:hypothetical protein [Ruminococcus turbiniformis]MCC2253580.1 hypothetical protein [Ruminococcus turbiniformis]